MQAVKKKSRENNKKSLDIVAFVTYTSLRNNKEVNVVNENERRIAEYLAVALELLPDSKKEFLLGYAEGVAAMAARKEADNGTRDTRIP